VRSYCRDRRRDYYRCPVCCLVFVPPWQFLSAEEEKKRYDLHRNSPEDPGYRRFLSRMFIPLQQWLATGSDGLDFGSGPEPMLSRMFEEAGHSMTLFDHFYEHAPAALERPYDFITATEVVEHREGGDPSTSRKSPGRSKFEAVTLERGVTHDREFEQWANKVWNFGAGLGSEVSLQDFRKDIIIELYNEAGQLAIAYKVYRCWVSEFQSLPDLDANANAVAIQHIKLENEGWERDYEVTEPTEPAFTEP